jgi:CsoR family transcriptional regulator, copper-sensing transcriptional repressor
MSHDRVHANRASTITNFKKAQSLIARMQTMIEAEAYCVDIMQQNLAVIGLLKSAHQMLMEDHLHACFENAMQSTDDAKKAAMVEEILKVTKLVNK